MKTRVILNFFFNNSLRKPFFDPNAILLNLAFLTILEALNLVTLFNLTLGQITCKKMLNLPYLVAAFPIFCLRSKCGFKILSSLF